MQVLWVFGFEGWIFGGGGLFGVFCGVWFCLGFLPSLVIQLSIYFCYKLALEGCGQITYGNIFHLSRYSHEHKEF